ncbi:hypothetical protein BX600DRAFT_461145 [Xylariales sp. PMI_506]|nr:hypothetical protein BX600DRAFT_461145 [Xylariales sp. PMI_506]
MSMVSIANVWTTLLLFPAIDGIIFQKLLRGEHDVGARRPLMSLIWIPLKTGVNLHDDARMEAKLWKVALDFICRFAGCRSILWGTCFASGDNEAEEPLPALLMMIHWRDAVAWSAFQSSPGFYILHMTGLMRGSPFNATVVNERSNWDDAHTVNRVVEITLVKVRVGPSISLASPASAIASAFASANSSLGEGKGPIDQAIRYRHSLTAKLGSTYCTVQGLERYAAGEPRLDRARIRAARRPDILAAMVVWKSQEDYIASLHNKELAESDKDIEANSLSYQRIVANLQQYPLKERSSLSTNSSKTRSILSLSSSSGIILDWSATSLYDLVSLPPNRNGIHSQGKIRSGVSTAPIMIAMDKDHLLAVKQEFRGQPKPTMHLDAFRIQVTPGLVTTYSCADIRQRTGILVDLNTRIYRLRQEFKSLRGYRALLLLPVMNVGNEADLLLFWETDLFFSLEQHHTYAIAAITKELEMSPDVLLRVETRTVPDVDGPFVAKSSALFNNDAIIEMTTFYVLPQNQELFTVSYPQFVWWRALECGAENVWGNREPAPMRSWGSGWDKEPVDRNGQEMLRYTAVVKWIEPTKMPMWYQQYAQLLKEGDYERLGLALDAMRTIAVGGIESRLLYASKTYSPE